MESYPKQKGKHWKRWKSYSWANFQVKSNDNSKSFLFNKYLVKDAVIVILNLKKYKLLYYALMLFALHFSHIKEKMNVLWMSNKFRTKNVLFVQDFCLIFSCRIVLFEEYIRCLSFTIYFDYVIWNEDKIIILIIILLVLLD